MRRLAIAAAAALLAAATSLVAVPAGAEVPAPERAKGNLDVTKLFPQAVELVRSAKRGKLAKAVMLEVQGQPEGATPVEDAKGIVRWRFVFDNQKTRGSKFMSAYVDYEAGEGFGKVQGVKEPFLEDWRIKEAPEMTLKEAVAALRGAGYADPFANVTLRRPLLQEGKTPPLYIFGFAVNDYVAVNTKTGAVAPF